MTDLKFNILQILKGEEGLTFLELKKQLEDKNIKFSWKELKLILIELEEKNLIEERHFKDGKVDYSLEPEGYKYLKIK
ncbi:MAG: hypothetical protein ABIH65_00345 [Nanoarchaeota archaeon]